jgi:hypothetical protein
MRLQDEMMTCLRKHVLKRCGPLGNASLCCSIPIRVETWTRPCSRYVTCTIYVYPLVLHTSTHPLFTHSRVAVRYRTLSLDKINLSSPAIKQRASHQITPHKKGIAVFPSSTTTISSLAYALFAYRLERLELDTSAQDKSKTPACGYNTHSFSKPADPTERRSTQ